MSSDEEDGGSADQSYRCDQCDQVFKRASNLKKHVKEGRCDLKNAAGKYVCPKCDTCFTRMSTMRRHLQTMHPTDEVGGVVRAFGCGVCPEFFGTKEELAQHREEMHRTQHHCDFRMQKSAHNHASQLMRAFIPRHVRTQDEALQYSCRQMATFLRQMSTEFPYFKVCFTLHLEMFRNNERGESVQAEVFPFRSKTFAVTRDNEIIEREVHNACEQMETNVDEFLFCGSGWQAGYPMFLDAEVNLCSPLSGGSCSLHGARRTRGVGVSIVGVDGNSTDGDCFYFAVAAGMLNTKCPSNEQLEQVMPTLKRLPDKLLGVKVAEIAEFERLNSELDLAVNVVYQDETGAVFPARASPNVYSTRQIVLMLFYIRQHIPHAAEAAQPARPVNHYAWVHDPDLVIGGARKTEDARPVRRFICWNCFQVMTRESTYLAHTSWCLKNECQHIELPDEDATLAWNGTLHGIRREIKAGFVAFIDFEALQIVPERACSCPDYVMENTRLADEQRREWEAMSLREKAERVMEEDMLRGEWHGHWVERCHLAREAGRKEPKPPASFEHPGLRALKRKRKVCTHRTKVLREQPPFAFAAILVDREGQVREDKTYVGEDAAEKLMKLLMGWAKHYLPQLSPGLPYPQLTEAEKTELYQREICYLCDDVMMKSDRVIDHDHLTSAILGVCHSSCNAARRENEKLTVFAHNFSGYDGHYLIKALENLRVKQMSEEGEEVETIPRVTAIPNTTQKFKTMTVHRVKFLDSMQFLGESLDKLVKMQKRSGCEFKLLDKIVDSPEQKRSLLRKQCFPYMYCTSIERLRQTEQPPARFEFDRGLSSKPISDRDWRHIQNVWKLFGIRNMLEYSVLYVRTDVYLLAEVMLGFRDMVHREFKLDLTHYLSLPHFAMDCMLKITGVRISLMSDQQMINLVKSSIRGGHSFINARLVEREVKRDENGEAKFNSSIMLTDCNNLYGFAMRYPLPVSDYRWLTQQEMETFDVARDCVVDNPVGYVLLVDLVYPDRLHEAHNSFPLAVESREICYEELSDYCKRVAEVLQFRGRKPCRKLTATFYPRNNYLVHGFALAFYLKHGLELKAVHKVIAFRQTAFMRKHVDDCSTRRMEAKTETEKNMWKLLLNSTYGKFIESADKRMDVRFDRSEARARCSTASPLFKSRVICGEDLSLAFLRKKSVKLKQCWLQGFAILEISKLHMAYLYYDCIKPLFGHNVQVVLSDTDSLLLHVLGKSDYQVMEMLRENMDLSNLDREHPLYCKTFAKKPGLLKNEFPEAYIVLVIGVKSKSYLAQFLRAAEGQFDLLVPPAAGQPPAAYDSDDESDIDSDLDKEQADEIKRARRLRKSGTRGQVSKAKGVKKAAKKSLTVEQFRGCIETIDKVEVIQDGIQAKDHVNRLLRSTKVAFDSYDNKRYLLCARHSCPYGSTLIDKMKRSGVCPQCASTDKLF